MMYVVVVIEVVDGLVLFVAVEEAVVVVVMFEKGGVVLGVRVV